MLAPAIAFVDLETTGVAATGDRITEIGIVRVVDGELVEEWSTLVNPECSIPPDIQVLTGITNDMVRAAPTFSEIRRDVMERLADHLFVAHNARFDYGFLKNEFRRVDTPFTADVLCTVRLSRRLYPDAVGHGLDAVIARHGLSVGVDADSSTRTGRHTALGDARALWQFVQVIEREKDEPSITAAVKRLLKIPSLPPQLPADALENLPEGPGVYRFYGVNDLPIYIGKSVSLRDRIRSHFSGDYRSANDMRLSSEIRRIEVEETAGELGALLRESALIKSILPLHNYRLRKKETAIFLSLANLAEAPQMLFARDIDWAARGPGSEALYGPFATKIHARAMLEQLAGEHGLCWRLLGWEKRGGPCFARQVHRCRGACIGEETVQVHGLRLATALAPMKLREWPLEGRAIVRERDALHAREEAHVFDRWHHVGTARNDDELQDLLESRVEIGFDPDIYRIVAAFIDKHPQRVIAVTRRPE